MSHTTAKEQIIQLLQSHTELSVGEIKRLGNFKDTPYVSRNLALLFAESRVSRRRAGKYILYSLVGAGTIQEQLDLSSTSESEVWQKLTSAPLLTNHVSENAHNILSFAFTEMLNNAIDHSKSQLGAYKIWREDDKLKFQVTDYGVGVFRSVMLARNLNSAVDAIQELLKGKLTTAPRFHSGEGIFWTSKISDVFSITSFDYRLTVNNLISDYTIEKLSPESSFSGSQIYFEISAQTSKSLQRLFRDFTFDDDSLTLDVTTIPIKLYREGNVWISRSQAKKVLAGLEKYKKIIFDFSGIDIIGQAFADEIFRVFNIAHPEIILEPTHMSDSVKLMVARAQNDPTGRRLQA